jgi:putative peptidoglycan lipid II flippase
LIYIKLSGLVATGRVVEAYALLCRAVRLMPLLTFAAQVCLTIAGFEAVYLIWGLLADRFTVVDAQETATVLVYLCLGLSGWAAQTVTSRGFCSLESTWLPTTVGTAIAAIMVPVYVVLRQQCGAIGLAIASSTPIMVYVTLLGWLQRRRFEREAIARDTTLGGCQEMLRPALRLAAARCYHHRLRPSCKGSTIVLASRYADRDDPAPRYAARHVRDWHVSGSSLLRHQISDRGDFIQKN